MKSKPATYLLIVGVIIIWGIIVWKILSSNDDLVQPPPAALKTEVAVDAADTLMLDYRDPFLGASAKPKKATVHTSREPRVAVQKPPEPEVVHNLRYRGKITKDNVTYGLVEINGMLNTMKIGEMIDDYKLMKIYDDSVKLAWRGKTITVESGN